LPIPLLLLLSPDLLTLLQQSPLPALLRLHLTLLDHRDSDWLLFHHYGRGRDFHLGLYLLHLLLHLGGLFHFLPASHWRQYKGWFADWCFRLLLDLWFWLFEEGLLDVGGFLGELALPQLVFFRLLLESLDDFLLLGLQPRHF
jgi:hypothetical protein